MGMDVYGKKPKGPDGEYFRNTVWAWHPLADFIETVAPDIACKCEYWHSNDGDGLGEEDSIALADRLQALIDSGKVAEYEKARQERLGALPEEDCRICAGTGIRPPVPHTGAGDPNNGGFECNACHGSGKVRPMATYYGFSTQNVQEFANFLRSCGGFEIC